MSVANSQFRVEDASTFKVVNRYTIVWLAIMYFDYLSTLDSEVLHVWTSKRPSLYQTLFLLNRYGTLVLVTFAAALTLMSVPLPICKRVMWISPLSGVFVVLVCDTIMSLRIDALYGKNRFIRWLLVVAITSELTVMIFMSTRLDALTLPPFVSVLTGFKGCTVTAKHVENAGIITALFWGSPLVVATLFFALTLYRSIDAMRGATRMRLYERFLTGQLKYFVVVAATHVVNVVLITRKPPFPLTRHDVESADSNGWCVQMTRTQPTDDPIVQRDGVDRLDVRLVLPTRPRTVRPRRHHRRVVAEPAILCQPERARTRRRERTKDQSRSP
ncbi:hypothetical protein JCM11491_002996 [Sporobolomyces phaffii]